MKIESSADKKYCKIMMAFGNVQDNERVRTSLSEVWFQFVAEFWLEKVKRKGF